MKKNYVLKTTKRSAAPQMKPYTWKSWAGLRFMSRVHPCTLALYLYTCLRLNRAILVQPQREMCETKRTNRSSTQLKTPDNKLVVYIVFIYLKWTRTKSRVLTTESARSFYVVLDISDIADIHINWFVCEIDAFLFLMSNQQLW